MATTLEYYYGQNDLKFVEWCKKYYKTDMSKVFHFTAAEDNSSIKLSKIGSPSTVNLVYSIDQGDTWNDFSIENEYVLEHTGDTIHIKNTKNSSLSKNSSNYYNFIMTGTISALGNIQYLLDERGKSTSCGYCCFDKLFINCSSLVSTPELPATTLSQRCYNQMFQGCVKLSSVPDLNAKNVDKESYRAMFQDCTSLTSVPDIKAEKLSYKSFAGMYSGCSSLVKMPYLSAQILDNLCYTGMFSRCISLSAASELPAITLSDECYQSMFQDCTGLIVPPVLSSAPATKCYKLMFQRCSSLSVAEDNPEFGELFLDATNITHGWWSTDMFVGTAGPYKSNPKNGHKYYFKRP